MAVSLDDGGERRRRADEAYAMRTREVGVNRHGRHDFSVNSSLDTLESQRHSFHHGK